MIYGRDGFLHSKSHLCGVALTYEIVHEFIDRIPVYELDRGTNTRKIEIYYSFVGQVDTGEAHTESISHFRQIGADVKSYAV